MNNIKELTQEAPSNFQYVSSIKMPEEKKDTAGESAFTQRMIRKSGLVLAAGIVAGVLFIANDTGSVYEYNEEVQQAVDTRVSETLSAGTVIAEKDDGYIGADYDVTLSTDEEETTIQIWDYASEDGDYVQILADDQAVSEPFMLTNKPVTYTVPADGEIKIVGIRDGGDGITYGIYYESDGFTVYNGVEQGGTNTYTFTKE